MKSKNVLLIFEKDIMYKPIIYKLATEYGIAFNILEAKILPKQEGRIILGLDGTDEEIGKSIQYMENEGVRVEILANKFKRDDEACVNCGACTTLCRGDALSIDRETMEVKFKPEKCFACGLCKIACPMNAMSGMTIDVDVNAENEGAT